MKKYQCMSCTLWISVPMCWLCHCIEVIIKPVDCLFFQRHIIKCQYIVHLLNKFHCSIIKQSKLTGVPSELVTSNRSLIPNCLHVALYYVFAYILQVNIYFQSLVQEIRKQYTYICLRQMRFELWNFLIGFWFNEYLMYMLLFGPVTRDLQFDQGFEHSCSFSFAPVHYLKK